MKRLAWRCIGARVNTRRFDRGHLNCKRSEDEVKVSVQNITTQDHGASDVVPACRLPQPGQPLGWLAHSWSPHAQ